MGPGASLAGTRGATFFALVSATLMIAHQVAGKATRDAMFLSHYDVTELPKIVIVAAILSMLAVVVMSELLQRFSPSHVIPGAFALSAALFLASWWFYESAARQVAIALYLQMAIFGAVLISGFWSVVNERFDPHTAKQTIARVAAAATLGGVLGGLLAGQVAKASDMRAMLVVLGALHLACMASVRAIGEPRRPETAPHAPVDSGIDLLLTTRYLRLMGILMVLAAMLAALVDYAFKSEAKARLTGSEELVVFFGQFYAAVGVLTFVVQSMLGPRTLRRFGIGVTLAVMPAAVAGLGVCAALFSRLATVVVLRGSQIVLSNSLFRSSFELLYTPLPPPTKRPTKALIDVASDRLGDVLGSGLILSLLALLPGLPTAVVIAAAAVLALVALAVVARLYHGYIEQLASSLHEGAISLREDEIVDATTRYTLAEVSALSERELLSKKIREMKYARVGAAPLVHGAAGDEHAGDSPDAAAQSARAARIGKAVADLRSADFDRIRRCLAGDFMDPSLAPHLLPLLGNDATAEDARMELRWMAPQIIGTLTDGLLDPDLDLNARQRIPSVIEITHNPRAVDALLLGLDDDEFNVRYSCARALLRMVGRDADIIIDAVRIYAAVEKEINVDQRAWDSRALQLDVDLPIDLAASVSRADPRVDYSMEHVFTLLSLVHERDALFLALQAAMSTDRNLRGTALEYLENILPENIRHGLWPHLGESVPEGRSNRAPHDLVAELKRAVRRG